MWSVYSWLQYYLYLIIQVKFIVFFSMASCSTCNFCLVWHLHIIFGIRVLNHEAMCRVNLWFQYDVDLSRQCKINMNFNETSFSGHNFFVLWHSHTLFDTWWYIYLHGTIFQMYCDLCKTFGLHTKLYFHHDFVSGQDRLCKLNFAQRYITLRQHVVTFMTSVWPWPWT